MELVPYEAAGLTRTAFDAETGEVVEITPEMHRRAAQMQRYMEMAVLVQAAALRTIADERLYLALGCSSFKEYAETVCPFGYTTAKRYLQIGRRLAPLLPGLGDGADTGVQPVAFDPEQDSPDYAPVLGELGISKLEFLTRLDDDDLAAAVEEGEVRLPSGKVVSLEAYREMTRAEIQREFKAEKRALRDRAQAQEEAAKLAASERDALEKENEHLKRELSDALRDVQLHGPTATKVAEKRAALERARAAIDEARFALVRSGVEENDPPEVLRHLMDLLAYLRRTHSDMLMQFDEAVHAAMDLPEQLPDDVFAD